MSCWWWGPDQDFLSCVPDRVITVDTTADAAVEQIMHDAGESTCSLSR
jgi:hypothetical protein